MVFFNTDEPNPKSQRVTEGDLIKGSLNPRIFMQGVYLVKQDQVPDIKTPPLWRTSLVRRRGGVVEARSWGAVLMIEVDDPEDSETVARVLGYLNKYR
ncbi:hypothetical protein ACLPHM_04210 [Paenalcaligenes sp. Me131]|uniref:hypothetical protein n=1 Tax=Paenalcaligenes sp. Me131 TaxID=3392636 RepID=UPI003D294CB3